MNQTQAFIAHIVVIIGVVGSSITLASLHIIDGATAIAMIAAVTGISLGAVVSANGATVATNAQASQNPTATTTTTTTAIPPVVTPVAPVVALNTPVPPTAI